jgi:hypothetical protein
MRTDSFVYVTAWLILVWGLAACTPGGGEIPAESAVPPTASSTVPPATAVATPVNNLIPDRRRLNMGELVLAASPDDIPAIFADDTIFVDAVTGSTEWADEELVIGLTIGEESRAYPVALLSLHEVVNDTVGGQPVLVTWCPLCFSALVFDRVVDGRSLTFGVSGYLYYDNLVMFDHQSETLWSQILGRSLKGGFRDVQLRMLPSQLVAWGEWKSIHPDTDILSAAKLGQQAEDLFDPYSEYYISRIAGITGEAIDDDRLPTKTLVVGLVAGDDARAYPLDTLRARAIINDELGGTPFILTYEPELTTVIAYLRQLGGQTLTFTPTDQPGIIQDVETESQWDTRTGLSISGYFAGQKLQQIAAPLVYWFAWASIHQGTDIYEE